MTAESGLDHMPGSQDMPVSEPAKPSADVSPLPTADHAYAYLLIQDLEAGEPLADVALLDVKIAEATAAMVNAKTTSEKRQAKERKEDLMRLKRVEQIYVRLPDRACPQLASHTWLDCRMLFCPYYRAGYLCF